MTKGLLQTTPPYKKTLAKSDLILKESILSYKRLELAGRASSDEL